MYYYAVDYTLGNGYPPLPPTDLDKDQMCTVWKRVAALLTVVQKGDVLHYTIMLKLVQPPRYRMRLSSGVETVKC